MRFTSAITTRNGACRIYDPRALYEKTGAGTDFQAGLSWITILRKRENFAKFHNFDPRKIARYGRRDVERLLKNEGIIRSRAKIDAAIKGARLWLEIQAKRVRRFHRADPGSMSTASRRSIASGPRSRFRPRPR